MPQTLGFLTICGRALAGNAPMTPLLYFLFFCSGLSGLIYQVVWVRAFGNVFGNTIYSASLVVAVFMLGLGVGSYVVGAWADRRYLDRPESLLRAYAYVEMAIAALGLGISALLPRLEQLSAMLSSYSQDAQGWYVLSAGSYLGRATVAVALLAPVTILMGGTLTLLIRHLVRTDTSIAAWRIALLYSVNTAGAAVGCLLTDLVLVPWGGLRATQFVAVALNVVAGLGALFIAFRLKPEATTVGRLKPAPTTATTVRRGRLQPAQVDARSPEPEARPSMNSGRPELVEGRSLLPIAVVLVLSGFAAMGMEIVWFRHFSILLGEFRAVFSLLLGIILVGIAAGSFAGGFVHRRTNRAAEWLIVTQGLFIVFTLAGLASADAQAIRSAGLAHSGGARAFDELWFNAVPMLLEVAMPALLMGFAFPLANAVIQRAEQSVGRRAGALYLANTIGAVGGSLAAGFVFLPTLGIQASVTILMLAAAAAMVPLYLGSRTITPWSTAARCAVGSALVAAVVALAVWLRLPSDYVIGRALVLPVQQLLTLSEGVTEVVSIGDVPGRGRMLLTNGHPMSSTDALSQRYMRGLAHIPLLLVDNPEDVLVMCFGVGNTAHAATLHPSVRRVEVVDLSRHVLSHARYFKDVNGDVLSDPRVAVHVNDGRHHLRMRPEATYDLITLEPPPIVHAGVGALYSREFYALARSRLKPGGYVSQWLPVSQVPAETNLAMIRAFIDVFPQSVLLSGADTNLLLLGVNDPSIAIEPDRIVNALRRAPAVQADLQRLYLSDPREIVGTFVASARTLVEATRDSAPATDDRPIQEYSARSLLQRGGSLPSSIVDVTEVGAWCPACFSNGQPVESVDGLDTYLALLDLFYRPSSDAAERPPVHVDGPPRVVAGSAYLGAVVPESPALHAVLGNALATKGDGKAAIASFREAVRLDPDAADARYRLATLLLETGQYEEALGEFRAVLRLMPRSVEVRNNLGVALASQGRLDEAIDLFQQALVLQPEFADARRNLAMALEKQRQR